MSVNTPPPILISRTPPSNPTVEESVSRLYLWRKVNWAVVAGRLMIGESSSFRPTKLESEEKAALGEVSLELAELTQADCSPVVAVVQPAGSEGAFTASKFSENRVTGWPITKEKETVPKFCEPSCNWNVGEMFAPQAPLAVKVNDLETAVPPATSAP